MEKVSEKERITNTAIKNESINNLNFSQCASCESPNISTILSTLEDGVLIIHSPTGCASSFIEFNRDYRRGLRKRKLPIKNPNLISTNLGEKEMIFGIDESLEEAVKKAIDRFNPRVMFITASCGSGVTALDIQDSINNIQNKFSIPLITIACEIYHLKKLGSGFNNTINNFVRDVVKVSRSKEEGLYNLINFSGDDAIIELVKDTGVNFNYIALYSSYLNMEKMGDAKATINLSKDNFSNYISDRLEKEFEVPIMDSSLPCGFKGTDDLLKKLGILVNKESEFAEIIINERNKYSSKLQKLRKELCGVKCLPIILGGRNEYEKAMLSMLRELGVEIIGDGLSGNKVEFKTLLTTKRIGPKLISIKDRSSTLYGQKGLRIASNENYQLSSFIKNIKPDLLLVMHYSLNSWGNRMGVPTLCFDNMQETFAYKGLINLGNEILKAISMKSLVESVEKYSKVPYSKWWMNQSLIWEIDIHE